MRAGFTVSIVGHAALLGFGLLAFSFTKPLETEKIDALPVDLVSIGEETDLLKGDESSRVLPTEAPQPKPEVKAEIPAPDPQEKPAEKPVEVSAPPPPAEPPPPPEPRPEPTPEPEPAPPEQVASIPPPEPDPAPPEEVASIPEPEPTPAPAVVPEPEPVAPVNPNVPRPRPNPPKRIVVPKPEPPAPKVAEAPKPPEREFDADQIQALLNKQEPAGGGDPTPSPEPQTIGSIDGTDSAAMTQSEIAALKARLYRCWNPPVAVREAATLIVTVRIDLLPDGSLAGQPQVINSGFDPLTQIAAESAVRAVVQCAPFGDILRPEKYAVWNQIEFVFDPREMLGG